MLKQNKHQTNKFFLVLLIFFLSFSFVSAEKIIEAQQSGQLHIAYPPNQVFKQGTPFNYTFMVHNSSGYVVTDATCVVNLVNNAEEILIYNHTTTTTPEGIHFIEIGNNIVDNIGNYNYHISCVNEEAGFLVSGFLITRTGELTQDHYSLIIFGILGVVALLFYLSFNLANVHFLLKLLIQLFGISFLFLIPAITLNILTPHSDSFYKLYTGFIWVFWIYIIIYLSYEVLNFTGKATKINRTLNNIKNKYKR